MGPMTASYDNGSSDGGGVGVGSEGTWANKISRNPGASKPAYSQAMPWQALLEQKELSSVPPGLPVVWQFSQVGSNTSRCKLIQLGLRCDSGSGPRLTSMLATKSEGQATTEWSGIHCTLA
jgi:hypothetical protein